MGDGHGGRGTKKNKTPLPVLKRDVCLHKRGYVGWLSTQWVECEGGGLRKLREVGSTHDATVMMSRFWNCPTRWHHDFGGWHVGF